MPTVVELTEPYGNFMLGPARGAGVCEVCFTFTDRYARCYTCARTPQALDAVLPISYSPALAQLHYVLAAYKRLDGRVGRRLSLQLAAVLWRFLSDHEHCAAAAAGVRSFDLVTTVPSGEDGRDPRHPLHWIVSEVVGPTRERHRRLLARSDVMVAAHEFDQRKFRATKQLGGQTVLLIDDTWTTGANAQSAAAALKAADAGRIAAVVIGRHLNREWADNDRRLTAVSRPFDWTKCGFCGRPPTGVKGLSCRDGGYQPPGGP